MEEPRHGRLVGFGYDIEYETPPTPQSHLPPSSSMLDGRVESPRAVGQEVL
jgi:hypothetical protein